MKRSVLSTNQNTKEGLHSPAKEAAVTLGDSKEFLPPIVTHSMFWWSLKVFCGTTLIAALFLKVIYELPSWFAFPTMIAQLLVLVGAGSTLWHYSKLKSSTSDISQPSRLVVRPGLFSLVRHPMYLSDVLVSTGLFLLFPTIPTLLVLGLGWFGIVRQAQVEDGYMLQLFGEEFTAWQKDTKLIFPYIS